MSPPVASTRVSFTTRRHSPGPYSTCRAVARMTVRVTAMNIDAGTPLPATSPTTMPMRFSSRRKKS